jgi:ribosomal protein L7Ae-like RNA K-turn-binding protein
LTEAKRVGVPVLYCMSRRRLGKAVGSSLRQSAVAVCGSATDSETMLASVIKWIDEHKKSDA